MPTFYVQTETKKHARDGERFRGFIFETDRVTNVPDFAEALADGDMISGFRLEIWGKDPSGKPVVTRYPMAVGMRGVVTISEYQKPDELRRGDA